jgi:hypothetical protein
MLPERDKIFKVVTPIIDNPHSANPVASFIREESSVMFASSEVASGPDSRVALCRAWERNHHISLVLGTKAMPLRSIDL